jgi:hypothetical protein
MFEFYSHNYFTTKFIISEETTTSLAEATFVSNVADHQTKEDEVDGEYNTIQSRCEKHNHF